MVDIQMRALGALKEDRFFFADLLVQEQSRITDIRFDLFGEIQVLRVNFFELKTLEVVEFLEDLVLFQETLLELGAEESGLIQIDDADAGPQSFVAVAGANASPGGADFNEPFFALAQAVINAVVRKDEVRAFADPETVLNRDIFGLEHAYLLDQSFRVHDDAAGDYALDFFVEDTRRDEMKNKFTAFFDDRVAGVVPALIPDNNVRTLGEDIDDLAFAFIAPLSAYDNGTRHKKVSRIFSG